jgi:hypothetical protein
MDELRQKLLKAEAKADELQQHKVAAEEAAAEVAKAKIPAAEMDELQQKLSDAEAKAAKTDELQQKLATSEAKAKQLQQMVAADDPAAKAKMPAMLNANDLEGDSDEEEEEDDFDAAAPVTVVCIIEPNAKMYYEDAQGEAVESPVPLKELWQLHDSHAIDASTRVWTDGMEDWVGKPTFFVLELDTKNNLFAQTGSGQAYEVGEKAVFFSFLAGGAELAEPQEVARAWRLIRVRANGERLFA